jgi:lysophospholipase L1-like esterase
VLLCLALGEIGLRSAFHLVGNYDYEMWKYASELKQPLATASLPFHHYPERTGRYYGVEISTNALGLRDREYSRSKPPGVTRVIVLGDSFTLGWGVPVQETAAKQLERSLNAAGMQYEVINMGTGNYNSSMEVELFKQKGLALGPDIVVLFYFANDMEPTPPVGPLRHHLLRRSYLLSLLFTRTGSLLTRDAADLTGYYRSLYDPAAPAFRHNTA